MKKILVFGAKGMLGHVAAEYLSGLGKYSVVRCARNIPDGCGYSIDVTDFVEVKRVVEAVSPHVVLNAVGMLVKDCESAPDQAILVNAFFPHYLESLAHNFGFKLVHVSTDCVFSGKKGGYTEASFRDGDSVYDRTKALGEVVNDRDLTIRTSIIGPELNENGTGLFNWFMRQRGTIKGFSNAFWSGVTTLELAKAIDAFIEQNVCGLYQLCMPKISKYKMLCLFKKIWERDDIEILESSDFKCDKSLISTRDDFIYKLPDNYESMFHEMRAWMENSNLYSRYSKVSEDSNFLS